MLSEIISSVIWGQRKQPELVNFGYTTERADRESIRYGHDTIDGEVILSQSREKPKFQSSRTAPALVGVMFGFWVNLPRKLFAQSFHAKAYHPAMGPEGRTHQQWPLRYQIFGGQLFVGYRLEDEFELVLGDWSFELWNRDRRLMEQTLQLVAPAMHNQTER